MILAIAGVLGMVWIGVGFLGWAMRRGIGRCRVLPASAAQEHRLLKRPIHSLGRHHLLDRPGCILAEQVEGARQMRAQWPRNLYQGCGLPGTFTRNV